MFNKYLFAVPLKHPDAKNEAQRLVSIFRQHCYIPNTILSGLGAMFTSKIFKELTVLLPIQINQATLKRSHTIGIFERSHAVHTNKLKEQQNERILA